MYDAGVGTVVFKASIKAPDSKPGQRRFYTLQAPIAEEAPPDDGNSHANSSAAAAGASRVARDGLRRYIQGRIKKACNAILLRTAGSSAYLIGLPHLIHVPPAAAAGLARRLDFNVSERHNMLLDLLEGLAGRGPNPHNISALSCLLAARVNNHFDLRGL